MKALVTGGTGFIGSPVVDRLLEEGHAVRLFLRSPLLPAGLHGRDVEAFQGDLEDAGSLLRAMEGVDIFYHIGEIKNISRSAAGKNIALMEQVAARIAAGGIRRFVFVSSLTVAGIPSAIPALEDTEQRIVLHDHYTDYKSRCEEIIRERMTGCEHAIIRPAPVYGPGSRYLGQMIKVIEMLGPAGIPFIGNAQNIAPLIQVKDLARAIVSAGTRQEAAGQTFNITDSADHTWMDLFTAVGEAIGKTVRVIPVPPLLLKLPALPFDLFAGFFGLHLDPVNYLNYFSADLLFDNAKATTLLAWAPEYALSRGIKEMVAYYQT
ncbi:MAG TPA: NAD-dependent epimerase/dehydratase family protein [Thermodesulfovibrionales bacterium]|nr:NAD-dependent epimerase/dehydratase family protein [Thermodesulfovibrionales bacterium]